MSLYIPKNYRNLPEEELLPALKAELDRARAEQART